MIPTFFLGTPEPIWMERTSVPLFVSDSRLQRYKKFPRAVGPWACDSGGFKQIETHGKWVVTPKEYAERVRRYRDEIGGLQWAAIQDWMCEPPMIQKTGLSVAEHQRRTIDSLIHLRELAPDLPWAPVLQGWCPGDYLDHVNDYARAGIDLTREPIVGIGSVCRRQHTARAAILIGELADMGLKIHGFGFKVAGLMAACNKLASSDSMAWSTNARHEPPLPGHNHKSCNNCLEYALLWREELISKVSREHTLLTKLEAA